ncbi:MAG: helix-hairpin-helix domain-containing protein [Owenweeksia sp.]
MWKGLKEFSTYTRRQRNGIFVLLLLILTLWGLLLVDDYFYTIQPTDFSAFEEAIAKWEHEDSIARFERNNFIPFAFDPNEASDSIWRALGLSQRQAQTLRNYRSKGGEFYRFSDLEKMYGLDSAWLAKIKPYAVFSKNERSFPQSGKKKFNFRNFDPNTIPADDLVDMGLYGWQAKRICTYREKVKPFEHKDQLYTVYGLDSTMVKRMLPFVYIDTAGLIPPPKKEEPLPVIAINTADSLQLLEIRGVGPAFAHRILTFRERLGGFYAKEQLLEVYGMDEERYAKISAQLLVDTLHIKKISLNEASFRRMLRHPYMDYDMVKAIFNFRKKVRSFRSVSEIGELEGFNADKAAKLHFYLKL